MWRLRRLKDELLDYAVIWGSILYEALMITVLGIFLGLNHSLYFFVVWITGVMIAPPAVVVYLDRVRQTKFGMRPKDGIYEKADKQRRKTKEYPT